MGSKKKQFIVEASEEVSYNTTEARHSSQGTWSKAWVRQSTLENIRDSSEQHLGATPRVKEQQQPEA